jgi:maleate isomerase
LVKEVDRPEAQAVVISCTNLRTVGRIETMEHDLRKPVVSAIQASFWDCLRIAGVHETVAGFGRLLTL